MESINREISLEVSQRNSRLESHKPCCVLVVDRSGARFFRYWLGKMSKLDEIRFQVDITNWKRKDVGHVAHPGIKTTRGSQPDVFQHRIEAQYSRLCTELAHRTRRICEAQDLATIFLVGSDRLTGPLKAAFPRQLQRRTALIKKDLGGFSTPQLRRRLEEKMSAWTEQNLQNSPKAALAITR